MQAPKDGLTQAFYELMSKLKSVYEFIITLNRFNIITKQEMQVLYHDSHTKCVEQLKRHD